MSDPLNVSRRTFLGIAGSAISATALAANMPTMPQIGQPPARNKPEIDADSFKDEQVDTDVLVIGSGIAGLFAAVKAHDAGARVLMVSKGRLGSSGLTPFGKGIFTAIPAEPKLTV